MPRTKTIRTYLYYLRGYTQNKEAMARLRKFYRKAMGKTLDRTMYWRHIHLQREPDAFIFYVYLNFLYDEKAILPAKKGQGMFAFAHPQLLKKAAAARTPAARPAA